tara:strand:+ start:41 stop:727 length:687 start_codon:yes stop_codon:yes gene_type:complete
MEFIETYKHKQDDYTKKIKDSIYIENIDNFKEDSDQIDIGYDDICEIFLIKNDINYQLMNVNEKSNYVLKKKMEIASDVKNFNYNKKMTINLISNGLQSKNQFSSILYLNDYYKCNLIIYNHHLQKYYQTGVKDHEKIGCIYKNNKWFLHNEDLVDIKYSDNDELKNVIQFDIPTNLIYNSYLKSLSKYKIDELILICNEMKIDLKNGTKKKLKKELYDEINLKKLNE